VVDGFHIPIWKRTKNLLAIVLSWGEALRGRGHGGNVNNVQNKTNQNCESPPYIENILIKIYNEKFTYNNKTFQN
jgi:hypothetical protein